LHDHSLQTLLATANDIHTLTFGLSEDSDAEYAHRVKLTEAEKTLLDVSEDMRRLSNGLRPAILEYSGLLPALNNMIDKFQKEDTENATSFSLNVKGEYRKLNLDNSLLVSRIVQEALNNCRRHSGANKVSVNLHYSKRYIQLTIIDNGEGFRIPKSTGVLAERGKMGIIGMRQKAELLNGKLNNKSKVDKGTLIYCKSNV